MERAATRSAWLLPGPDLDERQKNARVVVDAIFWGYLWALDSATAQAYTRLEDKVDQLTSAVIAERERMDVRVSFDEKLLRFPPILRELPITLRDVWPHVEVVLNELTNPLTRDEMIGQWSNNPPGWMEEAPTGALVWLALVGAAHDSGRTSFKLWDRAVDRGFFPHGLGIGYAALDLAHSDAIAARQYLDERGDDHPFCAVARAAIDLEPTAIIDALDRWTPTEPYYRARKQVMTAAAHLQRQDIGQAVTDASQAWTEYQSTGAAVLAAQALLVRAQRKGAVARIADAEKALELAIGARDRRREWGGDSAEAVEFAVIALHLLHDAERAWILTQTPPGGEATVQEARDSRIAAHAALAAALTGRVEAAREYARGLSDFDKSHVEAVIAEWVGDGPGAAAAWQRSWDNATNDLQRVQAASGLVQAGQAVPDLTAVRDAFPDVASELEALAEALSASDPIAHLRTKSTTSPMLLLELCRRLRTAGHHLEAAQLLDEGASRWGDPVLAAMAAREYADNGYDAEAVTAARHALAVGGPNWAGRRQMLGTVVDAEAARQHWSDAAAAAQQMLTESPGDVDAQWALTMTLFNSAEPEKAWESLTLSGRPLRPRRRTEVMVWLRLGARFAGDSAFIGDAFEIVGNWTDDESVFGTFVQMMLAPGNSRIEVTEEQAERIRASLEEFTQKFPDSAMLRTVAIGPEEDPLAPMKELLRQGAERDAEVARQAQEGAIPLGLLSVVVNRTYAEASLRRAANGVLAEFYPRPPDEMTAAASIGMNACVIDVTVAHTLVLLGEPTRTALLGAPRTVATTDAAYRDAMMARDALGLRPTMTVGWDTTTDRPVVHETSEEQAAELAVRAEQLILVLGGIRREPHPILNHFPSDFEPALPSLGVVDIAKTKGYVVWSDDRVLRRIAASMGVPTFGTLALLDALLAEAKLDSNEHSVGLAKLLGNYYSDIPFLPDPYNLAADLDGQSPGGAAHALSRASTWADAEATFAFLQRRLRSLDAADPQDLRTWCGLAAMGLLAVASGNTDGCSNNLFILLSRCISESWCTPAALPFVLGGIRNAMQGAQDAPLRDPLELVLRAVHRVVAEQLGDAQSKPYLLGLVAQCSEDDKRTAARVILTAPRR